MNDKLSRQNCVLYVCGIVPVVWLALLAAPLLEGGLGTLLKGFGTALENPFHIVWCDKSLVSAAKAPTFGKWRWTAIVST